MFSNNKITKTAFLFGFISGGLSQCTEQLALCPASNNTDLPRAAEINLDTCKYDCTEHGVWNNETCACECLDERIWCVNPLDGACSFQKALDANTLEWWCPGEDKIDTCGDGVCAGWATEGCDRCIADCGYCDPYEKPQLDIVVRRFGFPAELVIKVWAFKTYLDGNWTQSFELPVNYTIAALWGANFTRSGTTVTLQGLENQPLYLYSEGRVGATLHFNASQVDPKGEDEGIGYEPEIPLPDPTESGSEDGAVSEDDNGGFASTNSSPMFSMLALALIVSNCMY